MTVENCYPVPVFTDTDLATVQKLNLEEDNLPSVTKQETSQYEHPQLCLLNGASGFSKEMQPDE